MFSHHGPMKAQIDSINRIIQSAQHAVGKMFEHRLCDRAKRM